MEIEIVKSTANRVHSEGTAAAIKDMNSGVIFYITLLNPFNIQVMVPFIPNFLLEFEGRYIRVFYFLEVVIG